MAAPGVRTVEKTGLDLVALVKLALQDPALRAEIIELAEAAARREVAAALNLEGHRITGAEVARRLEVAPRTWARRSKLPELAECRTPGGRWRWPQTQEVYSRLFG